MYSIDYAFCLVTELGTKEAEGWVLAKNVLIHYIWRNRTHISQEESHI